MAYNLSANHLDEVAITGKFVSSGRQWANVFKGVLTNGAATSTELLTAVDNIWGGGLQALLSQDVSTLQIACRQIVGFKPQFGSFYNLTINHPLGAISSAIINDPGSGYHDGTRVVPVGDQGPGIGGRLNLTFVGGSLSSVTVNAPGSGYVAPFVAVDPPDNPPSVEGNPLRFQFGASDFKVVAHTGGVATDRATSFNAFSIRLRSARPGRFGRSSAHWPGVPEASTTLDALTNAAAVTTAAQGLYQAALVLNATPSDWQASTLSLKEIEENGVQPGDQLVGWSAAITTVACNTNVGSMLRRKVKV